MPKPRIIKYTQAQAKGSTVYDSSPGTARNRLYGFFSDTRDRRLTGRTVTVPPEEYRGAVVVTGPFYDERKEIVFRRSYANLPRDKRSRPIK